jgi:signal transduction histidine kinase
MAVLNPFKENRLAPAFVVGIALAILGTAILVGTHRLRANIRAQMVNRDGEILHAVAQARQLPPSRPSNQDQSPRDPADDLALALELSRLKEGVLAVRLFDSDGKCITAFPPYVAETVLDRATMGTLNRLKPVSAFRSAAQFADFLLLPEAGDGSQATPLLEVNIPIHDRGGGRMLAAAQLLMDATALEAEFVGLDGNLYEQALVTFLAGGGLLAAALLWAFRRLAKSNALLHQHTERLLQANRELTIAVKTGALGAITAHLVHGLRHPLGNLQEFVRAHASKEAPIDNDQWQHALQATRRIQRLVNDIVRILGETDGADQYEITLQELSEILTAKIHPHAQESGVRFVTELSASGTLANQQANLVLLILENLLHNALQATPARRQVRLAIAQAEGNVVCEVHDAGPGIPPHVLQVLFTPCRSTKGGSGLGLAISRQLALQMGAQLELQRSDAHGAVFALRLPRTLFCSAPVSDCVRG